MRRWLPALLVIALSPALIYGGSIVVSMLPPFNPSTDVGKVPKVQPNGTLAWSTAGGSGAVAGPAVSVSGDLATFSGTTGQTIADSGILATNVAIGATASSVTANDLVAYAGTGGRQTKDSGIPAANVVLVSRAVLAGTGLTVTNSGLLSADITLGISPPVSIGNGGTNATTAASGFVNLSPQGTKGDLIGYSTSPQRIPVGTDGYGLISLAANTNGIQWTYDRLGIPGSTGPTAGYVGEQLTLSRTHSNSVSLTSNTACNVGSATCPSTGGTQSITLTAGDWYVTGACEFTFGATTTTTYLECGVTKTSATLPGTDTIGLPTAGEYRQSTTYPTSYTPGASSTVVPLPAYPVGVTGGATMTLYLYGYSTFATSTNKVSGHLMAKRIR